MVSLLPSGLRQILVLQGTVLCWQQLTGLRVRGSLAATLCLHCLCCWEAAGWVWSRGRAGLGSLLC